MQEVKENMYILKFIYQDFFFIIEQFMVENIIFIILIN